MTKAVVTGGCGFIGSHIVDRLVVEGFDVEVIDDLSAPENEEFYFNNKAVYHKLDVSRDDCFEVFEKTSYVFHLAARSRIQPTIDSPNSCFEVNVVGSQRVLDWSRRSGVSKFIYSGTSSLYGHQNSIPFLPNMPADCLNPYSMSKWMGEQICKLYSQNYGLDTDVLRYFNVYGPREPVKGQYAPVIGLFKRQRSEGNPMTIVGDGEQRRDFTYIEDVVEANILSAFSTKRRGFNIYNVGSGKNYSINQIADMIGGERKFIKERPAEVRETLADIEDTRSVFSWSPVHSLEEKILSY